MEENITYGYYNYKNNDISYYNYMCDYLRNGEWVFIEIKQHELYDIIRKEYKEQLYKNMLFDDIKIEELTNEYIDILINNSKKDYLYPHICEYSKSNNVILSPFYFNICKQIIYSITGGLEYST